MQEPKYQKLQKSLLKRSFLRSPIFTTIPPQRQTGCGGVRLWLACLGGGDCADGLDGLCQVVAAMFQQPVLRYPECVLVGYHGLGWVPTADRLRDTK